MTTSTTTQPQSRKSSPRPSVWRQLASMYIDILLCAFIAWVVCFTFGWQSNWSFLALFLWVVQFIWCQDRLHPTAGKFCMGIRYLTSSSSQVVADIQVIHSKLKLNGALLTAGVVELTLAIAFLSGWTFLGKAVVWGFEVGPPASLGYWAISGLAFFICSGYILSGSKNSIWAVPVIHVCFIMEFFKSYSIWESIFKHEMVYTPWVATAVVSLAKSQPFYFLGAFDLWAVFLIGTLFSFRRHLVN